LTELDISYLLTVEGQSQKAAAEACGSVHDQAGTARAARGTRSRVRRCRLIRFARGQNKAGASYTKQISNGFDSIHGFVSPNGLVCSRFRSFCRTMQEHNE
jgi:hypothetical protein